MDTFCHPICVKSLLGIAAESHLAEDNKDRKEKEPMAANKSVTFTEALPISAS